MADTAVAAALIFADEVLSHLRQEWNFRRTVRSEIEEIRGWLKRMQAYLKDMEGKESSEGLRLRICEIRELAYDIEDILDEYMLYVPHRFHRHGFLNDVIHWRPLHEVISKIKEIKRKKDRIVTMDLICPAVNVTSDDGASSSLGVEHHANHQILEANEIVGFEKPREDLIRQLTGGGGGGGGSSHLTISVVGPGGSGKTLLAKSVYRSEEVQEHFDSHAWVRVSSPSLKIKGLINSMLKQIGVPDEGLILHEGENIKEKLEYYLNGKRYVLVLDDIWSRGDWEHIKKVLPSGSSGSRIIVTTRNIDVASLCAESSDFMNTLDRLSSPEDWSLFCKKAFQTSCEKCPPELVEWYQKILKKCEGIPLAIVAVGCLLSKKNQVPNEWKKLHDSLGSEIETHANLSKISRMLLPSYKDLPTNLKSCFLYFSIFPEDYSIKRGRLTRLWIAEGFVMKVRGKTPEEVAEDYLNQLIGRNLVDVSERDFDGRARSCRVLNLVLEFVVSKSEDENFVSILSEPNNSSSSIEKVRRLSIRNACATNLSHSKVSKRFSCVRSTFFFRWDGLSPSEIGNALLNFRLLRVLDLQDAPLEEFPQCCSSLPSKVSKFEAY